MSGNTGFLRHFDHAAMGDTMQKMLMTGTANSAGMAIKAGSSAIAKFANTSEFFINGKFYSKATADVALPTTYVDAEGDTVAAVIPTGYSAVVAALLDASGNVTSKMSIPVVTGNAIQLPDFADTLCCIGCVVIANATGADFVNATTALDKSLVTTTYSNLKVAFPFMTVA